jgi:hypothetical protein
MSSNGTAIACYDWILRRNFSDHCDTYRNRYWRRLKLAQYQEFVLALSGIVEGRASPEGHRRYTDAVNSMALIASPPVLTALREFQAEISFANVQRSATKHDRLLDQLFRVMRSDLHPARDANDLSFTLGVIGVPPQ